MEVAAASTIAGDSDATGLRLVVWIGQEKSTAKERIERKERRKQEQQRERKRWLVG